MEGARERGITGARDRAREGGGKRRGGGVKEVRKAENRIESRLVPCGRNGVKGEGEDDRKCEKGKGGRKAGEREGREE